MRVISASRRTDIPAFYTPWLLRRLDEGFCHALNPRSDAVARVSLVPADVLAIGLFTRDPRPLLPHLEGLQAGGLHFYAHMTVNGYPEDVEPRSPELNVAVSAFRALAEQLGPHFTIWRYDPIVLSERFDPAYHLERFSQLASVLAGACEQCVVSFVDPYAKTRRNLAETVAWEPGESHLSLAEGLLGVAREHGIRLTSCAEPLAEKAGISAGACVDPQLIAALRPDVPVRLRRAPTRESCLCHQALDIGVYHTCAFGCAYCYATETPALGLANRRLHDPSDTLVLRPPHLRDVVLPAEPPAADQCETPSLF